MSDRIAVMNEGRIEHLGTPRRGLFAAEARSTCMEFVGQSTRIAGRVGRREPGSWSRSRRRSAGSRRRGSFAPRCAVVVGVRPEAILLGEGPEAEFNNIRAKLFDVVYLRLEDRPCFSRRRRRRTASWSSSRACRKSLERGSDVAIRWRIDDTMVFPAP